MALHGKLEYYTDIMRTLFLELMEQYVVAKNPKLMLRRCVGGRGGRWASTWRPRTPSRCCAGVGGGRGARWEVEVEGCGVAPAESSLQFVSRCRQCR